MANALVTFKEHLPTRKNETWKYTNLNFFFEGFDAPLFEGEVSLSLLNNKDLSSKVDIKTESFSSLNITSGNIANDQSFQLNQNIINKKIVITINESLDSPLIIKHKYDKTGVHASIVEIKSNVEEVHICEEFISYGSTKSLISNLTYCHLDKQKKVHYTSFQNLNTESLFLNSTVNFCEKASEFHNVNISKGSRVTRHNIHSELNDKEAYTCAHGLYLTKGKSHIDTNSFIYHNAPHTNSAQLYKSVLDEESRGVFTGLIRVEKNAQLINSEQLNKNLLLSTKAQANSRPQLEIYADDVKCAHGSTTGQIREDELFYFQSRGIKAQKARSILAKAFINEVIFKVKDEDLKRNLLKEVQDA